MSEAPCSASPLRPKAERASLSGAGSVAAFAVAVVVASEFIVVGLLPEMARDLGISLAAAGHFVSGFALSSALLGPVLLIPASRWQPRLAMSLALLPFLIGNLAVALFPSYEMVLIVRVFQGATLPALVSIASARLAGLAGSGREGEAVSLVYTGVIAGMVVAMPAGTALAGAISWRTTFAALAALAVIAAGALLTQFPRLAVDKPGKAGAELTILREPAVQGHLGLSILLFAAMFAPYTYLAAYLETAAGYDAAQIAAVLMGFGLAGIPGNMLAAPWSKRGPTRATLGIALILAFAMAAMPFAGSSATLLLPLMAVWGAAHAAAFLLSQLRVMQAAPTAPAFGAALNISAANVGIAGGAAIGGALVEHAGIGATGPGGAVLALMALACAAALRRAGAR